MREELKELVSDEEVEKYFRNTNFGENPNFRKIIADTLLKYAGEFSTGNTSTVKCRALGLLGRKLANGRINLTKKGRKYLYYAYSNTPVERATILNALYAADSQIPYEGHLNSMAHQAVNEALRVMK
ncbi:MAG: hypothetical protein KAS59_04690 [Alphaproteobacteria bacterium]|nr:hypothetical protein [Alphaproteobacteria bacterium]